jgi:regulation of enolase protein 1 (concanavalin A-like superfamily)
MIKSSRFLLTVAALATLGNLSPADVFAAGNRPAFTRHNGGPVDEITVADFNHDGRMDIAGVGSGAAVSVYLSFPDGTYREAAVLQGSFRINATAASDLNEDGHPDLLVVRWSEATSRTDLTVHPGNGDGTFREAQLIAAGHQMTFVVAADFNGDGRQDVATGEEPETVRVFPGNGDFTFGTESLTTVGPWPTAAAIGDFNQDGKPDLAVVSRYGFRVFVLLNQGDATFAMNELWTTQWPWGIVATDLNRDGRPDLAVVASADVWDTGYPPEGFLAVHLNTGGGTFGAPATYQAGLGAVGVAAGDFNGDGSNDVVTLNRSSRFEGGMSCGHYGGSDGISVFTGTGGGSLDPPAHFTLDTEGNKLAGPFQVLAAHLNDDGLLDLVAAPGTIFLGRAAAANRPPTAFAWEYQPPWDGYIRLASQAADPDHDFLTYRWTDASGAVVGGTLERTCIEPSPGEQTYTLTVTDGSGASAVARVSVILWDFPANVYFNEPASISAASPYKLTWTAAPPDDTPIARFDLFVSTDGTTFHPIAECSGLPGAARECLWQQPGPEGNVILRIVARTAGGQIAGAHMHGSVYGTPPIPPPSPWQGQDIGAVGRRGSATYSAGTFTVSGSGADIWGTADAFHYFYQALPYDGDLIVRVAAVDGTNAWTKAGVMIRESLTPGSRHVSMFVSPGKGVAYQRRLTTGGTSLHTTAATATAPYWLKVTRRDKYIRAFHSADGVNWGNIGLDPFEGAGQMYIGLAVTSHDNTALGTGVFDNVSIAIHPRNLPPTVRLTTPANGSTFRDPADVMLIAEASDPDDGVSLVQFQAWFDGQWSGLAVDAEAPWSAAWPNVRTGTYTVRAVAWDFADARTVSDPVTFTVTDGSLEGQWTSRDIGAVGVAGGFEDGDPVIVEGSGSDIWGTADAFHYAWRDVSGDFQIIARVATIENVHAWTKAGVMIREHTGPSSRHVSLFASPSRGIAFQRRLSEGGASVHTDTGVGFAPIWLKLVRAGNTVYAYRSPNGVGWYLAATQTITLSSAVKVGLAVTSHDNTTLATATFSHVDVSPLTPWTSKDIGGVGVAGTTSGFDPMSVEGSGADIWGTADAFRFAYKAWTGDGEVIAQVTSVENTHAWAKAGVMIRGDLESDAPHAFLLVSPGKGIAFQSRADPGGLTTHATAGTATAPYWVRLVRQGTRITAFTSPDGAHWTAAGSRTIALGETAYLGLAVTSHDNATLSTATFQSAEVRR